MVRLRPYLGVSMITIWKPRHERTEFIHAYLWKLMEEPSSILYTELRANQGMRSIHRYDLPESNSLLTFFLSDARVAEDSGVYKPIGDYVLMLLDELRQDPALDSYNRAVGYFAEHEVWKSPLYATIRFFDIMVEEALHQNIEWHMWLYYMPSVVKKMARNYRLNDPLSDPTNEFPNRYAYLIYEIFSCLKDWVRDAAKIPRSQANVVLKRVDSQHENGNIPKSSIKALCQSLFYVMTSEHLGNNIKHSSANGVFSLFFEIRSIDGFQDYATVLLRCLEDTKSYDPLADEYVHALQAVFSKERAEYRIVHRRAHVDELMNFLASLG
jgi:hypothetical protein